MILTCLGHAKFLIELESGLRVVTDPYDGDCGYPVASVACDVALVSHHHHDHDAVETLTGSPRIIDRAGAYALDSQARLTAVPAWHDDVQGASHHHHDHDAVETLTGSPRIIDRAGAYALDSQARLTAVPAWHDDVQGAKRGDTLLFLLEAEGLRLAHLGDLGCPLTAEQREALAPVDVLMLPVGGYYTIDAAQARDTALQLGARMILPMHYRTAEQREALAPVDVLMLPVGGYYTIDAAQARDTALQLGARMILPMHYRTAWTADWPIAPVETFTSLYPNVPEPLPLVRVTRADLPCQPPVAVLLPQVEPKE